MRTAHEMRPETRTLARNETRPRSQRSTMRYDRWVANNTVATYAADSPTWAGWRTWDAEPTPDEYDTGDVVGVDRTDWHELGYTLSDLCPCEVPGTPAHLTIDHDARTGGTS